MAVALFRIKNTTDSPISWTVDTYQTAYNTWGERASVAINGVLFWTSGSSNIAAIIPQTHVIAVPANGTSTSNIIFSAGSATPVQVPAARVHCSSLSITTHWHFLRVLSTPMIWMLRRITLNKRVPA